jgi:hypothetical protein
MRRLLMLCWLVILHLLVNAQAAEPLHILVTQHKTVSLQFPAPVVSADRGRNDVLLQRAKGTRDVLLIKAASAEIPQTNVTVVTADGRLYSLIVDYAAEPAQLLYVFEAGQRLEQTMAVVAQLPAWLRRAATKKYFMEISLDGIYVKEDLMFLSLSASNDADIDYGIGSFQLSIVDQKQARRTARQEIVLEQKDSYGMKELVEGKGIQRWVIAVPRFTIPDRKYLSIQLMEKEGGRHLQLKVSGRTILKARALQ